MNGSVSPPGTFVLRRGLDRLRASAMLKQSLLVFAASMVLNICGFVAHAVASRQLGVTVYGGLYALINAALIAALPAAFVAPVVAQLAAEFRALHDDAHLRGLTDGVAAGFAKLGVVYVVIAVCGAIPFARFLHVPFWSLPIVGLLAGVVLFVSALRAVAQGTQDFIGYALSNSIEGIAKVCGIAFLIAVGLRLGGGIVGFFLGPLGALIYLGVRLRRRYSGAQAHGIRYDWRRIVNAGAGAAAATIALALMGSADVVLVKHFFDPHAAGLYAAASLGGKILLYLVGFVSTVLLPAGGRPPRSRRTYSGSANAQLGDVCRRRALRSFRLSILWDRRSACARRTRLRRRRAVVGDVRHRDGAAGAHERAYLIRHRHPSARLHGAAPAQHVRHAGRNRSHPLDARNRRGDLSRRQLRGRAGGCRFADSSAKYEQPAVDRLKRILLIGGSGQLGTAIRQRWKNCEIVAPARAQLDIEQSARVRDALERVRPDILINAAAFHDVDRCEEEPERAFAINALAVGAAAAHARDCGAVFVTISTDYVFDGAATVPYAEACAPHPLSVYGMSKLAGEYLVECLGTRAFVVRTCGLYGPATANRSRQPFVERVLSQGANGTPLRVVCDVIASPTFTGNLADALARLIETKSYGLYHAVDSGEVSWYDFACEAVRQAGIGVTIEPISAAQRQSPAARPRFSALENAKLGKLGITMPSWRAGIAAYLRLR